MSTIGYNKYSYYYDRNLSPCHILTRTHPNYLTLIMDNTYLTSTLLKTSVEVDIFLLIYILFSSVDQPGYILCLITPQPII